jgi:MFS family permease
LEPSYVGISSGLLGGMSNIAYGFASPYIGALADRHHEHLTFMLMAILPWFAFGAILFGSRSRQS